MNAILPDTSGYERCLLVAILTTDPGAGALPYLANGLTFSREPREDFSEAWIYVARGSAAATC